MAKVNIEEHRDNEFLNNFFELEKKVDEQDLTLLSDEDLRDLYEQADASKNYYNGMQKTVKQLANSIYGACGSEYFRFYNPEVAADITTEGKLFMFVVDHAINDYYHTWKDKDPEIEELLKKEYPDKNITLTNVKTKDICVYGDTDSRYVAYGDVMKSAGYKPKTPKEACDFVVFMENNRIQKLIADSLHDYIVERNGKLGYLIMELETIGGKGIYLVKKKYVMSLFWKDGKLVADKGKIKSTGVEIQQGSTTQFVKKSIMAVLHKLLTPGTKMTDIYKMGVVLVERAKAANPDDIIMSSGISDYKKWIINDKDTIVYAAKGTQAHVRAAAEYNHFIHVNNLTDRFPKYMGGKIHWAYALNKAGVFGVPDGVNYSDLPGAPAIDYEKQVEKLIINPIKRYIFNSDIDKSTFGQKDVLFSFGQFKKV